MNGLVVVFKWCTSYSSSSSSRTGSHWLCRWKRYILSAFMMWMCEMYVLYLAGRVQLAPRTFHLLYVYKMLGAITQLPFVDMTALQRSDRNQLEKWFMCNFPVELSNFLLALSATATLTGDFQMLAHRNRELHENLIDLLALRCSSGERRRERKMIAHWCQYKRRSTSRIDLWCLTMGL